VLLHSFPDDARIDDRLVPLLAPTEPWPSTGSAYGRSDRAQPGPSDHAPHQQQLRVVLDALRLDRVALVGHDAGGSDAIDYAVGEPGRVARLVLLNPYKGHAPTLRLPEAIRLLATPPLRAGRRDAGGPEPAAVAAGPHRPPVRAGPDRPRRRRRHRGGAAVVR
jgi:pimeloyl-ACP methyl ester carboxylesterase